MALKNPIVSVKSPTLPININTINTTFETVETEDVIPRDSPTVASADIHSNKQSVRLSPEVVLKMNPPPIANAIKELNNV